MATRKAHARWEGSLKEGRGGKGTNPEELLGASTRPRR